jgi:hypothetical protein
MPTSGRLMRRDGVVVRYPSCAVICFSSNVTDGNCEDSAGKDIGCGGLMQVSISLSNSLSLKGIEEPALPEIYNAVMRHAMT